MVLTTPSSLALCAFTCVASVSGVFFLARSAVRHVQFLRWPLLRQLHRFFLWMLIRSPRMRLSLLMRLLIVLMMGGFWLMRRLFRRIMVLCLFTPSGLMMMLVLQLFSLLVFCLSLLLNFWVFLLSLRCGPVFVSAISPLVMPYTSPWSVRSMLFSRVTLLLMTSMHRVLLSGASLILSAVLGVVPAPVARLSRPIWSFIASMSSCLGSVRSLSPGVLSCLLVAVFLSWRCFLRFVLRRLAYVVLVCWRFPLCSLLVLLRHLLHRPLLARVLRRSCPLLLEAQVAPVHIATIATMMVILSLSATRRRNTCARLDHHLQGLRHLPRQLQPLL
ncbi:uncharacterized protein [Triticum aestivum]|uniref:uncharacterized protein isoform X1 n=1 Tax=Triticum aestivum TaxID=4565 RepID=UPI001D014537|nr:uncharacterized protein LOC123039319 isoform X1 [Triticum aestivum]XP_044318473.1 uncharacterized protein LOC123039319 isoform X1 [Triticum aestivum]XP_044318479.1 uncharacterized protein LOC123039319 isoform X1 [Triticum aestivum]XP_044318484.1 uncharacterized protein LOC123039319 isoform X1 [Triticum aestivum]XP_044318489.1 uncharacterized protein LOC123039319 isoform X1 [Triticum aestivum]XP_044318493.1 uncharacterized protein LOC123039319 isoform X1 [Triticum aestivum]XP_044318497.1 un